MPSKFLIFLLTIVLPNYIWISLNFFFLSPIPLLVSPDPSSVQRVVPERMLQAGQRRRIQKERPKHGREKHHY